MNRFGTLTYAGDGNHDPVQLRLDVAEFFIRLRERLRGREFPYLWVPEWHPGGHGLHVHYAMGRWVNRGLIRDAWGHGMIDIRLIGDLPVGSGVKDEARVAARYLAKYAGKAFDDNRVPGLHRYDVAQGFSPKPIVLWDRRQVDVIGRACERMGREPSYVWDSAQVEDWQAPPAVWLQWD